MGNSTTTATKERAISLLSQGNIPKEAIANALGVTVSEISQIASEPENARRISELKFQNLAKHNETDNKLDSLETKILDKLESAIDLLYRPLELARILSIVNSAKRRGSSAPDGLIAAQQVIPLVMPTTVIQNFGQATIEMNAQKQVVRVGSQDLVTVQSANMTKLLESHKESRNESSNAPRIPETLRIPSAS